MQDCADLISGRGFYTPYGPKVGAANQETYSYYVRGNWPGETAENWGNAVITTPVSVEVIHNWLKENPDAFIAAIG